MVITYNGIALGVGGSWLSLPKQATIGGRTYPTVDMPDGHEWLAVNLDFAWSGLSVPTSGASASTSPQAVYYDYDESTYGWDGRKCGLLYNWYAVKYLDDNRATLCPGWHVPTKPEFDALVAAIGDTAGTKLKASNVSWASSWGGTDDYGFAALPAGDFRTFFEDMGYMSRVWSVTESSESRAYGLYLGTGAVAGVPDFPKINSNSVRLVKDYA